jgi:hypothetical protein
METDDMRYHRAPSESLKTLNSKIISCGRQMMYKYSISHSNFSFNIINCDLYLHVYLFFNLCLEIFFRYKNKAAILQKIKWVLNWKKIVVTKRVVSIVSSFQLFQGFQGRHSLHDTFVILKNFIKKTVKYERLRSHNWYLL